MKYGTRAASTRQRLRQYEPYLAAAGFEVEYHPLLTNEHIQALVDGRKASPAETLAQYGRRAAALVTRRDYDLIWVHCELFPYLPGLFERLGFAPGKPIIFDYDDAIFHMYDDNPNPAVRLFLGGKLEPLLKRASLCCCGNPYLLEYASRFCRNSVLLPTVVDTSVYRPRGLPGDEPLVVGWIGSPSTWKYVRPVLPVLEELVRERGIRIRAVGAGAASDGDGFPGLELVDWEEEREAEDVASMDIGIMPLPDENWARGKCGYKLIQYMACGLPVVASPVGVNAEIVADCESGFLASSPEDWRRALERLISDRDLRNRFGSAGRQRVERTYSLQVTAPRLIELLREVSGTQASPRSRRPSASA